jgi:hypothetical protein
MFNISAKKQGNEEENWFINTVAGASNDCRKNYKQGVPGGQEPCLVFKKILGLIYLKKLR